MQGEDLVYCLIHENDKVFTLSKIYLSFYGTQYAYCKDINCMVRLTIIIFESQKN